MNRSTLKYLVATDNHLGAFEKTPIRKHDSFITFEEILAKAVQHEVDFILLGGDLFDENKPTHATLHRTMTLLRKYCMGPKPIEFSLVSDPRNTLHNATFGIANFQDPNLNISIPIFAIHGNHDDPVGEHGISAINLLSACGLINYFGRSNSNDKITINPVLLQKGDTKLALYGLGHVRDERLHRCFLHKKVKFLRPAETPEDWFNCFVLHQNRGIRGGLRKKNGVKEEFLKGFLDLVIWGHEHDTLINPLQVGSGDSSYDIIQPGSSVCASNGEDPSGEKKVCIVEVEQTSYKVTPVPLLSTRPVETATIILSEEESLGKTTEEVDEYLSERVEDLIIKVQGKVNTIPDEYLQQNQDLRVPIIRLKVDYSPDYPLVNPVLFGGKFMNRVANPHHLLLPLKRVKPADKKPKRDVPKDDLMDVDANAVEERPGTMAEMISHTLSKVIAEGKSFEMVSEHPLTNALIDFVEKNESNAMQAFLSDYLLRAQKGMWREARSRTDLTHDYLKKLAQQIRENVDREWHQRNETASAKPQRDTTPQGVGNPLTLQAVKLEEGAGDMPAEPRSMFQQATPEEDEIGSIQSSNQEAIAPLETPDSPPAPKRGRKAATKKAAAKKPAAKRAAKRGRPAASDSQLTPEPLAALGRDVKEEPLSDGGDSQEEEPAPPKKRVKKATTKAAPLPTARGTSSVMAAWGKKKS